MMGQGEREGEGEAHDDGLVLLSPDDIHARRRPVAIAVVWAYEVLFGIAIAWPAAAAVKSAFSGNPRGDAALFTPGGLDLVDLFFHADSAPPSILAHAALLFTVAAVLGLVPFAFLLVQLAYATREHRPPPFRLTLSRTLAALRPLGALFVAASAVEIVLLALAFIMGGAIGGWLASTLGDSRAEQIGWAATVLLAAFAAAVGVAHDLARAAVVRLRITALEAARLGLTTLRRRAPHVLMFAWGWRTLAGWALVGIGSLFAEWLGGRGGFALLVLTVIHQGIALSRVGLRASWLARGMRALGEEAPSDAGAAGLD
jgi:hypothetical protein